MFKFSKWFGYKKICVTIKFDTKTGYDYEKCFPLKKSFHDTDNHKNFAKITDYV